MTEQDALDRMKEVLDEVPRVRKDMGYPPLVTPTSQIVGTQAVQNVLFGRYKMITSQVKDYAYGLYGKPPAPMEKKVQELILKGYERGEKPITCRAADILEQELEKAKQETKGIAKNLEDALTYAMYPTSGLRFVRWKYGLEPVPDSVKPKTLEQIKKEDELFVAAPLLFAMAAAVPAGRPTFGWNRKRDSMPTFTNVGASQTAYCIIPRYPRTIFGMVLQLGGTTFTKALISRIELFLGDKSIWGPVTGTQLDNIHQWTLGAAYGSARSDYHLGLDFTFPNVKETAGEYIGGLDISTLPEGTLRLEVDIGAATSPTLSGWMTWGAPQNPGVLGPLMHYRWNR